MFRRLILPAAFLALAACGPSSPAEPAAPAAPTPPPPTAAQMQAALASLPAPYDSADLDNGRRVFARCRSCHTITPNGPNMTGPNLYGVFGRQAGTHAGYRYSAPVKAAGFAWDAERIDHWLENPRTFLPGNKMTFPGIADPTDRRDLIAWLQVNTTPAPAA